VPSGSSVPQLAPHGPAPEAPTSVQMTIAHVATASAVRGELQDADDLFDSLQRELHRAQKEVTDARRAGAAVLSAVESAMAPMMAQLAAARQACPDEEALADLHDLEDDGHHGKNPSELLEDEVRHLELDITHYQEQVDKLQIEERQRVHELSRLRSELSEVSEQLAYEQHSVRHYQVYQQLGLEPGRAGGVGSGTTGLGKRTLEVRAETKLREFAEQRTGRLLRHVTRLGGDTAAQQSTIDQLSRRLNRVRSTLQEKDRQISAASTAAVDLQARLAKIPQLEETGDPSSDQGVEEAGKAETISSAVSADAAEKPSCTDASGTVSSLQSAKAGRAGGKSKQPRKTKSTGKLPHLSF